MWEIYDDLIDLIPEDLSVIECLIGLHWTLVRSETGIGAAMTLKGGKTEADLVNIAGMPLKKLAACVKSWNLLQASLGQAAINSVLNTPENVLRITGKPLEITSEPEEANGFNEFLPEITGKKVAVIGHFPQIEELGRVCRLSIMEREPQAGDYPDLANEYILPQQDYVFITGTALINKTMPRLLELCKNTKTIIVGPSAPLSPLLFKHGVEAIASMVILDYKNAWQAVQEGGKMKVFKKWGQMLCVRG